MSKRNNIADRVKFIQDKRQSAYGFVVFTIIVVLILGVGAIKPSLDTVSRVNAEIDAKEQTLSALQTKRSSLDALFTQYEEFSDTASDLELIFPSNGDFSLMLGNVENLTREHGFELNSVSFRPLRQQGEEAEYTVLQPLLVDMSIQGQPERLVAFLQKLESLPMFPEIVSITYSDDANEQGELIYSVSLKIYEVEEINFYQ